MIINLKNNKRSISPKLQSHSFDCLATVGVKLDIKYPFYRLYIQQISTAKYQSYFRFTFFPTAQDPVNETIDTRGSWFYGGASDISFHDSDFSLLFK